MDFSRVPFLALRGYLNVIPYIQEAMILYPNIFIGEFGKIWYNEEEIYEQKLGNHKNTRGGRG